VARKQRFRFKDGSIAINKSDPVPLKNNVGTRKEIKTMGWLPVLLGAIAAFLFYKTGHIALMILAIVAALGAFWSWGVMHNYATELAKRRQNYKGGFFDITAQEAKALPDWISWANMGFSIAGLVLIIIGIIMLIIR
jgi:hypothetical protein